MLSSALRITTGLLALSFFTCTDHLQPPSAPENPAQFRLIASQKLGGMGASEISAFDPLSKRLFTVNNETAATPKIDVLDLSALPTLNRLPAIDVSALGGTANSVAVKDGKLAIALEATNKQANGSVVLLDTRTLATLRTIPVGAMPDMVTFSPDGRYIVTADEGEPNGAYTVDPVGSVSIIDVTANYSVRTLTFESFAGRQAQLSAGGFRVFGPRATLAQDVEPEYVAISDDSRKAYVTLQENNGIAEVDLAAGTITTIWPLGTKDFNLPANGIDPSDRDGKIELRASPVKGFFLPDALAYFAVGGKGYLITADEGDSRDYSGFSEEVRIGANAVRLDATAFPNGTDLKKPENLGRLLITNTAGNTAGLYTELFTFGGRGFSILDAATGQRVYEAGKTLEEAVIVAGKYDDDRSDNKGIEPEGVTVGFINGKPIGFIALERVDLIAVYDLSNPTAPQRLQLLPTGDAPEGVLFIPAADSPTGRSLLVVSSEGDGTVSLYEVG